MIQRSERPVIHRFEQLVAIADGQVITVEGRYERWHPEMRPPHEIPVTARIVLVGGGGVLIGRYRDPESLRPETELARLAGLVVRVTGTYLRTRDIGGAVPGLWTGGGPQLVNVSELVEP